MNCAFYSLKHPDVIRHFLVDCVRNGNDFTGTNAKLIGVSPLVWGWKWTTDTAGGDPDAGYDKTVGQIALAEGTEIALSAHSEVAEAMFRRKQIADLTYTQIETYINNNVTDLASAREYLKLLSKVVLAIIKIQDKR